MNSQTLVPNWAGGYSARAFLGYGRAFLQGRRLLQSPSTMRCGGRISWPSQTR